MWYIAVDWGWRQHGILRQSEMAIERRIWRGILNCQVWLSKGIFWKRRIHWQLEARPLLESCLAWHFTFFFFFPISISVLLILFPSLFCWSYFHAWIPIWWWLNHLKPPLMIQFDNSFWEGNSFWPPLQYHGGAPGLLRQRGIFQPRMLRSTLFAAWLKRWNSLSTTRLLWEQFLNGGDTTQTFSKYRTWRN